MDTAPLTFPFLSRQPSPPSMGRMSFQQDPFASHDDSKRSFGRSAFAPYNNLINGAVGGQQHLMSGPFRDHNISKFTPPTALDVFSPQDQQRPLDFNQPSRDFGPIATNKPLPPHHNTYHVNGIQPSHHQTMNGHHHVHREEEISTIFVVGFPEDMQEREFQNMFTFAKGFEAASLKVPHGPPHIPSSVSHPNHYAPNPSFGPHDFNVISPGTMAMDPTSASWPMNVADDSYNHLPNHNQPPRKQIIGFAKFRSRADAIEARDFLQGRKVDVERGALLKAEMAKKNLHTKRGPGPSGLPLSMIGQGGMVGHDSLASLTGLPGGAAGLPTQASGEAMRDREKELGALGAMGFIGPSGTRHRDREINEKEPARDQSATNTSRMRFGNSDSETETNDTSYHLRSQNQDAFDAFHAVKVPSQPVRSASLMTTRSVLSPTENYSSLSAGQDMSSFPLQMNGNSIIQNGPWGLPPSTSGTSSRNSSPPTDLGTFASSITGLSLSSTPPTTFGAVPVQTSSVNRVINGSSSTEHFTGTISSTSISSASSANGSNGKGNVEDEDGTAKKPMVSGESNNNTQEPALPDSPPEYATQQTRLNNSSDQNPPINTLYVGNLPTSPHPSGYPNNHLEDSLRALFASCPGYRKLCFRQKDNGPMCFVEFDDIPHAKEAMESLYGNNLNGLVKSGIRLSYSKNPLGVRPGGIQTRHNGFHPTAPWSSAAANGGTFSHSQEPVHRSNEGPSVPQRSLSLREPLAEVGHNGHSQYSFVPSTSRFYSPAVLTPTFPHHNGTKAPSAFRPPSIFSPFQNDANLTPVPRDHALTHALTPSPSIESTRAG